MRSEATFDVAAKQRRIAELDERMAAPSFWDAPESAREIIADANQLKAWVAPWSALERKAADLAELAELLDSEPDPELEQEWRLELDRLQQDTDRLEVRAMLSGADDVRSALLTIHPGAGGTESQDWAEMLMRMYTRWAEQHDFEVTVLDLQPRWVANCSADQS